MIPKAMPKIDAPIVAEPKKAERYRHHNGTRTAKYRHDDCDRGTAESSTEKAPEAPKPTSAIEMTRKLLLHKRAAYRRTLKMRLTPSSDRL